MDSWQTKSKNAPTEPGTPSGELAHELDSADLYSYLARRGGGRQRAALMREMADAEFATPTSWIRAAGQGVRLPAFHLSFKTRMIKLLARIGGPRLIYPLLHGTEMGSTADYAAQDARPPLWPRGAQPCPHPGRAVARGSNDAASDGIVPPVAELCAPPCLV